MTQKSKKKRDCSEAGWSISLGAVPYAINSGAKYLVFRAYFGDEKTMRHGPRTPINKGFLYRFNSSLEIKLVKYTLEDNGFVEFSGSSMKQNQALNQGRGYRENWLLMWTTQTLKASFYQSLLKHQKVNHFPRSIELTRKDFLANRIHRMQDLHGQHHFNFWPRTFILPKESD